MSQDDKKKKWPTRDHQTPVAPEPAEDDVPFREANIHVSPAVPAEAARRPTAPQTTSDKAKKG